VASQYGVDIEIALQGAQKITALTKDIKALNKEVNAINKGATRLGKEIDKAFRVDSIQNYSRALNQAERALRNVASGTDAERRAVERVVRMRREANDALARQNMLLAQAAANQREVIATSNAGFGMQGPSLPKDFFKVQGPKLPPGFTEAGRKPKATPRISGRDRIGAAVSAGAFPLLFGGGPGMALGGAIGGAAAGATFGPAAIALQVLGGTVDQFVAQIAATGQALNEFTFDFAEVARAAGLAGTATSTYIEQIEKLADSTEAQEIATRALAVRVGGQAVESLKTFGDASADLGREFSAATTIFGAAIASLVSPLTQFTAKVLEANNALVAGRANATDDPELKRLAAREAQLQGGLVGGRTQGRSVQALKDAEELRKVQEQIRERQREILFITEQTAKIRAADLQLLENEKSIQTDSLRVLALRRSLLMSGKELTEEQIVELQKEILQTKFLEEKQRLVNQAKANQLSFQKVALKLAGLELDLAEALKNLEDKGASKTGPKSRALQLQAAILREQLKQLGIETKSKGLGETTIQNLRRQNQNIEERRTKELKILDYQRQQELANNKVAGDAKFINKLYDEREQTVRDTLGLELDQNNARINAIELQQKLARMRANQQTAGIGRGLRRQIEDAQRGMANPFDSNELQMLQLRVDQVRRSEDAYRALNEQIALNQTIIDTSKKQDEIDKATKENEILRNRVNIYRDLLPQLEAVEQAQLRQQQIIDQLTPATEAFAGALVDTVTGAQTAQEAFANFLRSVANMLADTAKKMIAEYIAIGIARMFAGVPTPSKGSTGVPGLEPNSYYGTGGRYGSFVPPNLSGKALGGQVGAGRPYMVGERGPELFVPGAQGNIVPNNAMGSANVTVNVDASGSSVEGNADQASQLGKAIGIAVQQELVKQKRPGGLLAS
tara:strand:- start:164 stop:2890 length:2727 start_codon:yes stop_codon:yes gene_type:complete